MINPLASVSASVAHAVHLKEPNYNPSLKLLGNEAYINFQRPLALKGMFSTELLL